MNDILAAKHEKNSAACIDLKLSIDWRPVRKGEGARRISFSLFPLFVCPVPAEVMTSGCFRGSHKPNFLVSERGSIES